MTEDDAQTKWCAFARVVSVIRPGTEGVLPVCGNRISLDPAVMAKSGEPLNPPSARCIASACMAWRWVPVTALNRRVGPKHGFCGLAGRPE